MAALKRTKPRFALVGSESLRGREMKSVLCVKRFPLQSLELYDPDVVEEFSKLTQFGDEPKVVHHLERKALAGVDLVFLASDARTNEEYGQAAKASGYRALDLAETFNAREDVPLVVAGVNEAALRVKGLPLIANPSPVTIVLAHLLHALAPLDPKKSVAAVLEPASAFEEAGIQELADQSFAMLNGSAMPKKVFREPVAFNLLSRTEKAGRDGFSAREARITAECRRVLAPLEVPLSLSIVLVPVFHTYSVMAYVELGKTAALADVAAALRADPAISVASGGAGVVSAANVAGKDKIFVGQIKKAGAPPGGFWVWAVADNLTVGSALNAYEIARSLFPPS